ATAESAWTEKDQRHNEEPDQEGQRDLVEHPVHHSAAGGLRGTPMSPAASVKLIHHPLPVGQGESYIRPAVRLSHATSDATPRRRPPDRHCYPSVRYSTSSSVSRSRLTLLWVISRTRPRFSMICTFDSKVASSA